MRDRLSSKKGFVWLKREITPQQQQEIRRLGIPGIGFLRENRRIYPSGPAVSHLIGLVNIDNQASPASRSGLIAMGWPICIAPALPPTGCSSRWSWRSICASNTRYAMSC